MSLHWHTHAPAGYLRIFSLSHKVDGTEITLNTHLNPDNPVQTTTSFKKQV